MRKRVGDGALIIGLAAIYVLTARLGLAFDPVSGFATLIWPPTGISLAALLLFGYRLWPGILIGAVVANVLGGASLLVALGIGMGNTAEALLGRYFLRRVPGFTPSLETVGSVVGLIVLAAGL